MGRGATSRDILSFAGVRLQECLPRGKHLLLLSLLNKHPYSPSVSIRTLWSWDEEVAGTPFGGLNPICYWQEW